MTELLVSANMKEDGHTVLHEYSIKGITATTFSGELFFGLLQTSLTI
jgi:hypothetical protein